MRKPTMWFSNRSGVNRPVLPKEKATSLKLQIYGEEEFYYPCSENVRDGSNEYPQSMF